MALRPGPFAPAQLVHEHRQRPARGHGWVLLPHGTRRILIHVNNTNPILDEDSAQRAELARGGVEVAYDGLEIML